MKDLNKIDKVTLNLLDGQVELILRSLELYGYNLEYMLDGDETSDELKRQKRAMLKFTYEQILSSQAEQVATKANNVDTIPDFGKILLKNSEIEDEDKKFHVV